MGLIGNTIMMFLRRAGGPNMRTALQKHFVKMPLEHLITSGRTFPLTSRVDLQAALENYFAGRNTTSLLGIHTQFGHETLSIPHLVGDSGFPVVVGPLQYDEVDTGEVMPARCLKHGLWLGQEREIKYAVLVTPAIQHTMGNGVHLEIAVPPGDEGLEFSRDFFGRIETLVRQTGSYRGKVISLESAYGYAGIGGEIRVHKLNPVTSAEVILPQKTLDLLERNVQEFLRYRENLRDLDLPVKKGLLFYGPPGTGKTHTIHYLAGNLPDHTTLLITAEQMGLLEQYFQLARFLQPAMVVIEDVDLIARAREDLRSACEESLLNRLLNEMDGLREDAAVLFVLTTNHPQQIEGALAARPGRIDQAIEFPLPDEDGRRKLVRLYARNLPLSEDVTAYLVRKTKGASPAFIKELMRRSAQYYLQQGGTGDLQQNHLEMALDEMLFAGGSLNVKLLGGAGLTQEGAGFVAGGEST